MLTKKYEPQNLDELIAVNKLIAPIIKDVREKKEIPHLMFIGPAGVGKSTTAFCIRNELFGKDLTHVWCELNASMDNGVDVVREKVNKWAKLAVPMRDGKKVHRIIFLDEIDNMTKQAQSILRRVMEDNQNICRFILACNYENQVIEPLFSRCQVYKFTPLSPGAILKYLKWIVTEEKAKITETQLQVIVKNAKGDMRNSLNMLEGAISGREYSTFTATLLTKSFEEFREQLFKVDLIHIFSKMEEEIIGMYGKKIDNVKMGEAMLVLSEYESRASRAFLKHIHAQACYLKLKKILGL